MDSVAVQMWARDGLVRRAEVGKGSTRSSCRCGLGAGLGPGAEVGGYEPSPVVSDERSPKCSCGRIGVSYTQPRCAARIQHIHESCSQGGRKPKVHRTTIVPQV